MQAVFYHCYHVGGHRWAVLHNRGRVRKPVNMAMSEHDNTVSQMLHELHVATGRYTQGQGFLFAANTQHVRHLCKSCAHYHLARVDRARKQGKHCKHICRTATLLATAFGQPNNSSIGCTSCDSAPFALLASDIALATRSAQSGRLQIQQLTTKQYLVVFWNTLARRCR